MARACGPVSHGSRPPSCQTDPKPSTGTIDSLTVNTAEASGWQSHRGRVSRGRPGRYAEGEEADVSAHELLHHSIRMGHIQPVACVVDAPVDARTGRRTLMYVDDTLDLAS